MEFINFQKYKMKNDEALFSTMFFNPMRLNLLMNKNLNLNKKKNLTSFSHR